MNAETIKLVAVLDDLIGLLNAARQQQQWAVVEIWSQEIARVSKLLVLNRNQEAQEARWSAMPSIKQTSVRLHQSAHELGDGNGKTYP